MLEDKDSGSMELTLWCQYVALVEECKALAKDAYESRSKEKMRNKLEMVKLHRQSLKPTTAGQTDTQRNVDPLVDGSLRNPTRVRTKGCGRVAISSQQKGKQKARRAPKCSVCHIEGHNRQSCPFQSQTDPFS